jgi:hypothetical protein
MKRRTFLIIFIFILSSLKINAQNLRSEVTPEDYQKLDEHQKELYKQCILESGFDEKNIVWLKDTTYQNLISDYKYYSTKVIRKNKNDKKNSTHVVCGRFELKIPQCLLFVNDNEVILQVYF